MQVSEEARQEESLVNATEHGRAGSDRIDLVNSEADSDGAGGIAQVDGGFAPPHDDHGDSDDDTEESGVDSDDGFVDDDDGGDGGGGAVHRVDSDHESDTGWSPPRPKSRASRARADAGGADGGGIGGAGAAAGPAQAAAADAAGEVRSANWNAQRLKTF